MKAKTKNWTPKFIALAVVCLLIGVGIGLLGYHYFLKPQSAVYEELTQGNTSTNWQSTKVESTKEMVEEIVLLGNGKKEPIDPKSEEGTEIASLLTCKLHELDLQAKCAFSKEEIQEIEQKDRSIRLFFKKPIDITISQWVEPEERDHISVDEKGYRILEDVGTALFISKDNLDEGLEGHILVGHYVEGRISYSCWAIQKEGSQEIEKNWIEEINEIISTEENVKTAEQKLCEDTGGVWVNNACLCPPGLTFTSEGCVAHSQYGPYLGIHCCEACLEAFSGCPIAVGPVALMCGEFSSGYNMSVECKEYFKEHPASVAKCKSLLKEQSNQAEFTDQGILNAVYSNYKYPEDFYQEDLKGASLYYENTISVRPPVEREHKWIELCTDNKSQALEWSESSSKNSACYRDLIDERETEKYFEGRRGYSEKPSDIILSRVHKCSYLDRSKYDKFERGTTLGRFNQRPVTIENVKELIEYLWFIENYNIDGQKVLSSFTEDQGDSVKHTIYETHVVYGDWGVCDQITLIKSEYIVDKNSGEITISQENVKTVKGKCH